MKKRIRKSKSIQARGAYSAGRATKETAVSAVRSVRTAVAVGAGSVYFSIRDFGRGLLS